MKDQIKPLLKIIDPVLVILKNYTAFIVVLLFLALYMMLVIRIGNLSASSPSQAQIDSKLQTIARPKIDPKVLIKIQQLQNQNIQVQALFNQARNNPFSE